MMKWFNVGKIVNTHGIKGEIRVISTTDFAEERYEIGNKLHIFMPNDKAPIPVVVAAHRVHKNFDLLSFEGYFNVNDVEKFKGGMIKVTGDQLGELEENEYYYHEIIGCTVYAEDGDEIGTIKEIINTGANDVWVIARKGQKDALIPYIKDIVLDIDVEEKKVIIHIMEGLL
ncbi:ribosome maturation factor RimM [Priestia taiwanensis]|uniref:Ribosome maturation factor RimM n=1 Tax=Priestia taiwanensis TaxID=1347902 RepID=A0A917API9_9BACI|nr:ribosome maturation factor RimM [Priestia taiwanensis]MBM7362864.1 16S rRNA processing protein RimM [Priestia taiwanensis]GGE65764.1 ribosome maturation factor RimM [Priestia taiwanensis]